MIGVCPLGEKESHACWLCNYGKLKNVGVGDLAGYDCTHPDYAKITKEELSKLVPEAYGKQENCDVDTQVLISSIMKVYDEVKIQNFKPILSNGNFIIEYDQNRKKYRIKHYSNGKLDDCFIFDAVKDDE